MVKYIIFWFFSYAIQFTILFILCDSIYFYITLPRQNKKRKQFKYYNKLLYNLFRLTPKRLGEYFQYLSSDEFNQSGLILYCGSQGEGKSYAMCHEVTKLFCEFPESKIFSNIWFAISDGLLVDYEPLLKERNGENGIIFMLDEISMWWNSRFRGLDPSVLSELVTNRKNHRVMFGTCQNISMCDKQVRIQATEYRNCHCFFGFFIVCTCWKPVFDFDGDLKDKKFLGFKFYFQDDVIRYSYDTYEMINLLQKNGSQYEKPIEFTVKEKEKCKKGLFGKNSSRKLS